MMTSSHPWLSFRYTIRGDGQLNPEGNRSFTSSCHEKRATFELEMEGI